MPVTIAVPSAGCVPDDPSRRATMYAASETPAPIAYASELGHDALLSIVMRLHTLERRHPIP